MYYGLNTLQIKDLILECFLLGWYLVIFGHLRRLLRLLSQEGNICTLTKNVCSIWDLILAGIVPTVCDV